MQEIMSIPRFSRIKITRRDSQSHKGIKDRCVPIKRYACTHVRTCVRMYTSKASYKLTSTIFEICNFHIHARARILIGVKMLTKYFSVLYTCIYI